MPRRRSARRHGLVACRLLAYLQCAGLLTGQTPPQTPKEAPKAAPVAPKPATAPSTANQPPAATVPQAAVQFRAPDGTRFVLLPDPSASLVHWAVASPIDTADDPAGLEGLGAVTALASLGGTWRTGSLDAGRERQALAAQDEALQALRSDSRDAGALQRLAASQATLQEVGDPMAFRRVLATLPTHDVEVVARDAAAVLQLTTLPEAIGAVGAMLVERREQQALRDLGRVLVAELAARQNRYDADPAAAVHTELLALALPDHPATRASERVGRSQPRRAQALAVWQATQRPERTVHVLSGGFDPVPVRRTLEQVFATTNLPPTTAAAVATPQPPRSLRRSIVPGVRIPMVSCAWVLPANGNPFELDVAARWLGDGPSSWLARALAKSGRKTAQVTCRAPWPAAIGGNTLLLVEVQDPAGIDGLVDLILQRCRSSTEQAPPMPELQAVLGAAQAHWTATSNDRRWFTQEVARQALLWPLQPPRTSVPTAVDPGAIRKILATILASQPIVVEGRR